MTRHWTLAVWLRIQEPRIITILQFFIYLSTLAAGSAAVFYPPKAVEGLLGGALTAAWAIMLLLGGLIGSIAVLPGIWWVERMAIPLCVAGLAMYAGTILMSHRPGNDSYLVQLFMIVGFMLGFGARWVRIRHSAYDPEK